MAVSLNFGPAWREHRGPAIPLEQFRCAFDGDRLLSAAASRPFEQWFGGRELPMAGIYGVATLPEHRGAALATRTITQLLHEAREDGAPVSALYPATLRPYRRLGYELAGGFVEHAIRIDDLPALAGPLAVEPYDPSDLEAVRACFRAVASHQNGPVEGADPSWWTDRILGHWNPGQHHRAVVARGEDGVIEGYTSFVHIDAEGDIDVSFDLEAKHFVWSSADALSSLIGFVRGYRGLGQSLAFAGVPRDPLALVVEEHRLRPRWTFGWMLRLLDVPGALERRGYGATSGSATLAVEDELFADNRGPWRIEAERGEVRVSRVEGAVAPSLPIGTLSSMYSGYLSAHDAARLGLLRSDEREVAFLDELFRGSAPFMYDFF
jgi:predicted acetyltransferase